MLIVLSSDVTSPCSAWPFWNLWSGFSSPSFPLSPLPVYLPERTFQANHILLRTSWTQYAFLWTTWFARVIDLHQHRLSLTEHMGRPAPYHFQDCIVVHENQAFFTAQKLLSKTGASTVVGSNDAQDSISTVYSRRHVIATGSSISSETFGDDDSKIHAARKGEPSGHHGSPIFRWLSDR